MRLLPARPKKTEERRRRRYGFWLFFAALIGVFFLVRVIPADWEIGPFRIDTSGNAADQASLYFADDPPAPAFWAAGSALQPPPPLLRQPPERLAPPHRARADRLPGALRQHGAQ